MSDKNDTSPLKDFAILEIIKRPLFLYLDVKYLIRLALCCHDSYSLVTEFSQSLYSAECRSNPLLGFLLSNISSPLHRLRYDIQTVSGTILKSKLPNLEFKNLQTRLAKIQSQTSKSTSCDNIHEKYNQVNISNTLKTSSSSSSMSHITKMYTSPNTQLQRLIVLRHNTYLLKLDTDNIQNLCTLTLSRFIKYRNIGNNDTNINIKDEATSGEQEGYWLTRVCGTIRPRYHFSVASHDDYGIVLSAGYNEEMEPLTSVVHLLVTHVHEHDFVVAVREYNNILFQSRFGHDSCFINDILWITGGAARSANNGSFGGLSTLKSVECIDFSPTIRPTISKYYKKSNSISSNTNTDSNSNSNSRQDMSHMSPLDHDLTQMKRCVRPTGDPSGVASMNSMVAMVDGEMDKDIVRENNQSGTNNDAMEEEDEFVVGDCLLCRMRYKVDDSDSSIVIGGNALHCAMCHSRENIVHGIGSAERSVLYDYASSSSFDAMTFESTSTTTSSTGSGSYDSSIRSSSSSKEVNAPVCISVNGISIKNNNNNDSSSSVSSDNTSLDNDSDSDQDMLKNTEKVDHIMVCGRYKHHMLNMNGFPCVVGGNNGPLSIEICDPVTFKWSLVSVLDDPIQSYSVYPLGNDLCLFADAGSVPPGQWKDIVGITYTPTNVESNRNSDPTANNGQFNIDCEYSMKCEYSMEDAIGLQALIVKLPPLPHSSVPNNSIKSNNSTALSSISSPACKPREYMNVTSSYRRYPLHSQLGARPMDVVFLSDHAK